MNKLIIIFCVDSLWGVILKCTSLSSTKSIFHPSSLFYLTYFFFMNENVSATIHVEPFFSPASPTSTRLEGFFRHHHSSFVFYSSCLHTLSSPRGIRASFVRSLACFFVGIQFHFTWEQKYLSTKICYGNSLWFFFPMITKGKQWNPSGKVSNRN